MIKLFKKHTENHNDIWDGFYELTQAYFALIGEVKKLREEVDYLENYLD